MIKLRLYLDNCCYNRPFDDQSQLLVRLETEAKLFIQKGIKNGIFDLVWSYILDIENDANPYPRRKKSVRAWQSFARVDVEESEELLLLMEFFKQRGEGHFKDMHIAHRSSAVFVNLLDNGRGVTPPAGKGIKPIPAISFPSSLPLTH